MKTLATLLLAMASLVAFGQKVYIPDAAFRAYIASVSPTAMTGDSMDINDPIITTLDSVNISNRGISNITGIFYFDSLHILEASFNNISSANLPARIRGRVDGRANFSHNPITDTAWHIMQIFNLDISYCLLADTFDTNIQYINLNISHNALTKIYINYFRIQNLNCSYNNLTDVWIGQNPPNLKSIDCSYNQIASQAGIKMGVVIEHLNVSGNKLSIVNALPATLKQLYCNSNEITRIVSLPAGLQKLQCKNNNILCLPVLPNTLVELQAAGNYIICLRNVPTAQGFVSDILSASNTYVTCDSSDNSCSRYVYVSGYVFVDANTNGIYDAGDFPVAGKTVVLKTLNQIGVTDANGYYKIPTYPNLPDTAIITIPAGMTGVDSVSNIVNGLGDSATNVNFPLTIHHEYHDVKVYITQMIPGHLNNIAAFNIKLVNEGNAIENGVLAFTAPTNNLFNYNASTPTASVISGDTVKWNFSSLTPGTERFYTVWLNTSSTAYNSPYQVTAKANIANVDSVPQNNLATYNSSVVYTYPRNKKTVFPTNYNAANLAAGEYVDYNITFQNTGNNSAQHAWIIDTLDAQFDMSTLYIVGASHNYTLTIIGNVLRVDFQNINIPDTSISHVYSHGFFRFLIKPFANQVLSGGIQNKAYIYFSNGLVFTTGVGINICLSNLQIGTATLVDAAEYNCVLIKGKAEVYASSSTGGFSYLWSTGATTSYIEQLDSGEYYVTVTDGCGTTAIGSVTIQRIHKSDVYMEPSITDPNCNQSDGSIYMLACSDYEPLTFLWSTGDTSQYITGLVGDSTYSCTVTDALGMQYQKDVHLNKYPYPYYTISNTDACESMASVFVYGGMGDFQYEWSNGATEPTIYDEPGWYYYTVTDAFGCIISDSVRLESMTEYAGQYFTAIQPQCGTSDLGQIIYNLPDGAYSRVLTWLGLQYISGSGILTDMNPGDYEFEIYAVNAYTTCYNQNFLHLNGPDNLILNITETLPATCGNSDGALLLDVPNATAPFTLQWSNGPTTFTNDGLAAGTYTVTVQTDGGCTSTATGIVSQTGSDIQVTTVVQDASCHGSNTGSAEVTPSGGAEPYTIAWSNGDITSNITQLTAGEYGYTITDAIGCSATGNVSVGELQAITTTQAVVNAGCTTTGSATISASGGTPPYYYAWAGGNNTPTATGLAAGTYTCTITDDNSCTATSSVTINQQGLTVNSNITNVACYGTATGSITLSPVGTLPYTATWSTGASGLTIDQLVAGSYGYTVSDAGGCTASGTTTITQNDSIIVTAIVTDVTCVNANTGSITLSASGGAGSFTYAWQIGVVGPTCSQLHSGYYIYTVSDAANCQVVGNETVNQPNGLFIQVSTVDAACSGEANGSATAVAIGGTPPYTYTWENNINPSALAAGDYTITVSDACSQQVAHFSIGSTGFGIGPFDVYNPTCHLYANGEISVNACGGTGNYTYTWSNGAQGYYIFDLSAGTYTVTISDGDNAIVKSVTLTQPDSISFEIDASCYGPAAEVSNEAGGTYGPYQYNWSNAQHTNTLNHVPNGTYQVTVSDYNGCSASSSINVVSAENLYEPFMDYMPNACSATGVVHLYSADNDNLVTFNSQSVTYPHTIVPVQADHSYHLIISDSSFTCTKDTFIYIPDYDTLQLVLNTAANPACYSEASGSIAVGATGGTAPYTYLWNTGSTSGTINNAPAGDIICTVTDAHGCYATDTFTLTQPTPLSINATTTDATCYGTATGLIQLTVTGGTGNYTYQFSDPNIGNGPIPAGTYSATVTDANGCTLSTTQTINEPTAILVAATTTDATCFGYSDGAIELSVAGGATPYSYHWSNNVITSDNDNLAAGAHAVTITDALGCIVIDTFTVGGAAADTYTITVDSASTCGASDGAINITMTSFINGPYMFAWSNNATSNNPTQLAVGTYTVTITNNFGCTTTATATIDCATAIDKTIASQINIYPNPATNLLYVNVPVGNNYTLSIHDIAGRLIKEQTLTQQLTELYLGDVAQGMYTLEVKTVHGLSKVERLVVR